MAKKRSMNMVEAHVEKVCLGIAIAVFLLVFVTRVVRPRGIDVDGETLSPSELIDEGSSAISKIQEDARRPEKVQHKPYEPVAGDLVSEVSLGELPADRIPLSPPYMRGVVPEVEFRYSLPSIPGLTVTEIAFQREMVWAAGDDGVLAEEGYDLQVRGEVGARSRREAKGADFVTVEATFPLGDLREQFGASFTGPGG